jgi:hypothetical protein
MEDAIPHSFQKMGKIICYRPPQHIQVDVKVMVDKPIPHPGCR